MPVIIRPASIKDFDFVYDFICQLEETHFGKKSFHNIFSKNLRNKNIFYLVAETEKSLAGFISIYIHAQLHHCAKVAEIMELFVDEKFRNKKTGAELIRAAIKIAERKNCTLIEVATNMRRKDAHRFYEKEKFGKTHFKFTKKL